MDELVCALGTALAAGMGEHQPLIRSVQQQLFDLGADLASEDTSRGRITDAHLAGLEHACDRINETLTQPDSFVLPGADAASTALHTARAICRRAERHAWAIPNARAEVRAYLNRLSDLLFIAARAATTGDEPTWSSPAAPLNTPHP